MEVITSLNNDRIKLVTKLAKSAKERRYSGKYIVEGQRMVEEIPDYRLHSLFFTQRFYNHTVKNNARLERLINRAMDEDKCFLVSEQVMIKMAETETPQGILAIVEMEEYELEDLFGDGKENPLILILERLQDPGNMGTIIRAAEGAGVTGILISYDSVDVYSPKVVRSTMGSIFRKKLMVTYDLIGDINKIKEAGVEIYGMHLEGTSMYEADLTKPVAFLIGNEGAGLSGALSKTSSRLIKIPMKGSVESLNAAISASLVSYEALRQRESYVDINSIF